MGAVVDAMILSRLFWLFIGVLIGLLLISAFIFGAILLLGLCLLMPLLIPLVLVVAGALLIVIGLAILF
jgi:hypothetical protein